MKLSVNNFIIRCEKNSQISRDFFTLTKEILNGELHFWVVFAFGPFPQIPDI